MDDKEIIGRVDELIKTERELRGKLAAGQLTAEEEHAALRSVEEALDQCWDLLRQRRARGEFGGGVSGAAPGAPGGGGGDLQGPRPPPWARRGARVCPAGRPAF